MNKEEFDEKFRNSLDELIEIMAANPAIEVEKFYGMVCFLENMAWFSPVLWGIIEEKKK